jgi:hypothetical protein
MRLMLATSFHLHHPEVSDDPRFPNQRFVMLLLRTGPALLADNLGKISRSHTKYIHLTKYHEAFLFFASGYTP